MLLLFVCLFVCVGVGVEKRFRFLDVGGKGKEEVSRNRGFYVGGFCGRHM